MLNTDQKLLTENGEPALLDAPVEEKLRAEIESLRRQLEEERKNGGKNKSEEHSDQPKHPRKKTLWLIGLGLLLLVAGAVLLGWLPRHRREKQLQKEAQQEAHALPKVNFVHAQRSGGTDELLLPGNTQALTDSPILARSDGYVVKRFVDIGDHVKKDQVMAIIAAPDLDQQVNQAKSQLLQALAARKQADSNLNQGRANEQLAHVTAERYAFLEKRGAVARQDNDTEQASYQAQVANVAALEEAVSGAQQNIEAAQANLSHLVALQGFEKVRAPFDGIVTLRNIDDGALVGNATTLLFRVAQIDRLRVYVSVPQPNAPTVAVGQNAQLMSVEFRDRKFNGVVTRTAGSLDPASRTLLTEVQVPNSDGTLRPGMFMQVNLSNQRPNPPILIPGDALIVRSNGTMVAILQNAQRVEQKQESGQKDRGKDQQKGNQQKGRAPETLTGAVHLQPVSVGRDYGNATEIYSGLSDRQVIIVNPNDDVREGAKVEATETEAVLDVQAASRGAAQVNANSEQLQPKPGAEPAPKQPSKTNKKRGPGY